MQDENGNRVFPVIPWGMREVLFGLGFILLADVCIVLVYLWIRNNYMIKMDLGFLMLLNEGVFFLAAWLFSLRHFRVGWSSLGFTKFRTGFIGLGCGLLTLSYGFNILYALLVLLPLNQQMQADLVSLLSNADQSIWLTLGVTLVGPFCEEVFFRGFLFGGLRQKLGWKWAAVVSSALFAILHLEWTAFLPIFILGLILAFLYEKSRSLWPAILVHATQNLFAFGVLMLASQMNQPV